ncbi:NUDIX domain-containing protein [Viridibacillus arvi]|uniref:NUDIX domain-containing protein n=1 Tax=Viridibacillus arvi TaxID=263475 RepID=UPI0034CE7778
MKTVIVNWNEHRVKLTWKPNFQLDDLCIVTSVHAICIQNNKVLLSKIKDRGFNYPGGHIESGESAEEAMHREVYEEAYVKGNITYLGAIEVNHEENRQFVPGGKYPMIGYQSFYRMDVKECFPFLRENEGIARIWVEPSEIPFIIDDHELATIILDEAIQFESSK